MLVRRLKLPGFKYVTSILHAACGLISTILSSIKMFMEQPVLLEIQKEEEGDKKKESSTKESTSEGPVKRIRFTPSGIIRMDSQMDEDVQF